MTDGTQRKLDEVGAALADRLSVHIDLMLGVRGAEPLADAVFDTISYLRRGTADDE